MNNTFYPVNDCRYLAHYGVKGMRWGIRRYQNEDGSLTSAGKKHYGRISGERTYKELRKEVLRKRREQSSWANQWEHNRPIGEHTKKIKDTLEKNKEKYKNTPEYKKWNSEMNDLNWKMERLVGSQDPHDQKLLSKYEKQYNILSENMPKSNEKMMPLYSRTIGKDRKYRDFLGNNYLENAGKDVTMAYLKDLGFNDAAADELLEKMLKDNRVFDI